MKHKYIASFVLLSLLLLSACGKTDEAPTTELPSNTAVEVQTASWGNLSTENSVSGKIVSGKQESLFVSLSARCTKVYVEVGDTVQKGQTICTVDLSSTMANYEAAARSYANAEQSHRDQSALMDAQIAQYEKNLKDAEALLAVGAASQSEVDAARLTLDNARVTRTSTLSQLETGMQNYQSTMDQISASLQNISSNGAIVSPMTGTVLSLSAAENSFVSASAPVIVVDSSSDMELSVPVSEALIGKLAVGNTVSVSIQSINQTFQTTISKIDKTADPATNLYNVTLSIPDHINGLLSGMFADVTFLTDTRSDSIIIPTESILIGADGQYVFTLDPQNVAHRVSVQTGLNGDGVTEILSGLAGGEQLVTVGQSYLKDGDTVRIVSPEATE